MYKILLLLVCLSTGVLVSAQNKITEKDLLGTWKITSVNFDNGAIYVDTEKDSLHISDELKKTWKTKEDSAMALAVANGMAEAVKNMELTFKPAGVYSVNQSGRNKDGNYVIDKSGTSFVTITDKEEKTKGVLVDNVLQFTADLGGGKQMVLYMKRK